MKQGEPPMKHLLLFLLVAATALGQSANDLIMSQRKSDNSGNIQRNVTPTANAALGVDSSLVPVALTGFVQDSATGAITVQAAGTNQSITLRRPGTGSVDILQSGSSTPSAAWSWFEGSAQRILAEGASGGIGDLMMGFASNTGGTRNAIGFRKSRGTLASPTSVQAGDITGMVVWSAYDGSDFLSNASLGGFVDSQITVESGKVSQGIQFDFAPTGVSPRATQARFRGDGRLQLGVNNKTVKPGNWSTAGATLQVSGYTATDPDSSGAVTTAVFSSFGQPAIAAANAITVGNAATVYIAGDVLAGANTTLTNSWGLWNVGKTRLDGAVVLPSTNTAGLQLYNTADQVTNFERLEANWSSNIGSIRTVPGGTGLPRTFRLASFSSGTDAVQILLNRAAAPHFQVGANTASAVTGNVHVVTNSSYTATSGTIAHFALTPTYNQASGTASNTDLLINRTETAVGSGAQYLIDAQVGGSSRFNVANTGVSTLPGSFIRTPATITINEGSPDTGTITITNGYSQATIDEATTLTPSAAGTNGQFLTLDVINSDTSAHLITVDTASDFTFTASASGTTTVMMRSNGSGWVLVGGAPTIEDLPTVTPVGADKVAIWDASAGTTGEATLSSVLALATPASQMVIPWAVPNAGAAMQFTNMPAALTFLFYSNRYNTKVDLTNFTQCRIVFKVSAAGSAGSKIILLYKTTADSNTVGDFSNIGTSEVSATFGASTGVFDSGWINLAAGAKADVFVTVAGSGGDGAADPEFGAVNIQFK